MHRVLPCVQGSNSTSSPFWARPVSSFGLFIITTSNAYTIREFLANAKELLAGVEAEAKKRWPKANVHLLDKIHDGGVWADQGIIAGCAGGMFDNIDEAAQILRGGSVGDSYFSMSGNQGSI